MPKKSISCWKSVGDSFADAPEAFSDTLANRLQGFEPAPALGRVEADALRRAVIDGHEDEGLSRA
jgi:hypothetical protein